MKRYLLFLASIVLFLNVSGQEKGIDFRKLDFNQALEVAKKEGKLVFIDCYTSWCGPCKHMANKVFILEKMGNYFNDKFVCLKYDMEKGDGPELAKRFRVYAYPTFLIVNPDGTLRHKWIGAMGGDDFIAYAKQAFDDHKALGVMEAKYNKGNRDKAFLSEFARVLDVCDDPLLPAVIEELMKVLPDEEKFAPDYRYIYEVVDKSPIGSLARKFFEVNREKFNEIMGKDDVDRNIFIAYSNEFWGMFKGKKTVTKKYLDTLKQGMKVAGLQENSMLQSYFKIAEAMTEGNINKIIKACEKEFPKLPLGQKPTSLLRLYSEKTTTAQKARWDKLVEENIPQE